MLRIVSQLFFNHMSQGPARFARARWAYHKKQVSAASFFFYQVIECAIISFQSLFFCVIWSAPVQQKVLPVFRTGQKHIQKGKQAIGRRFHQIVFNGVASIFAAKYTFVALRMAQFDDDSVFFQFGDISPHQELMPDVRLFFVMAIEQYGISCAEIRKAHVVFLFVSE